MASYKQIVLDIKDYISLETATIERIIEKRELTPAQKEAFLVQAQTLKDISDIIKEGGK